jgi:DNA-binding response OmpR family regulator
VGEKTILVADDEPNIVELVKLYLGNEGFVIEQASNGRQALERYRATGPALVVLDLMLPEVDGWEVCRQIRRDDIDKIVGLELGADDYLTKPFNPRELVARVKAVLRRSGSQAATNRSGQALQFGNTTIDEARHEVRVSGSQVELRAKEFELLLAFVQHLGLVLERDRLLNLAWGYDYFGDTRTVDVHVAHLRDRLQGSSLNIQTIRSVGYKMVLETGDTPP